MNQPKLTRRLLIGALAAPAALSAQRFPIRPDYLAEAEHIPPFWQGSFDEVSRFLETKVGKGQVRTLGRSAGGRAVRAVLYGEPRKGKGTTTFSGSIGFGDVRAYTGPDHGKKVYMAMCGVHGGEFEGMVGAVNLVSVIETGADLRGKPWPGITDIAKALDRIIVIPIANPDGRARVPLRMIKHRGTDETAHEYFNTGGKPDGTIIGWPQCKQHIPLDFSTTQFPGGYPNDAGVNIQHDDFMGARQPETQALLDLAATERPDLIMNMHTGAQYMHPLRPFVEPALTPAFEELYRRVMTGLTEAGLARTEDVAKEANPAQERMSAFNLDTALNLHCGALSVVVESPAHDCSVAERMGKPFRHTPDLLLDAQLVCHQQSMRFLAETGGRAKWTQKK
jgi:hypothetical protein